MVVSRAVQELMKNPVLSVFVKMSELAAIAEYSVVAELRLFAVLFLIA